MRRFDLFPGGNALLHCRTKFGDRNSGGRNLRPEIAEQRAILTILFAGYRNFCNAPTKAVRWDEMLLLFSGDNPAQATMQFAEEVARYGLWQVDLATGRMSFSSNMYRLLGLPIPVDAAEPQGEPATFATLEKVTHPDDLPVMAEIQHILAEGLPFERQFRVIHPNGRVRSMSIHGEVVVDPAGRKSRAIGVLMDVTSHAESVHASLVDSERVRAIMGAIDGRLWTARSDGFRTDLLLRGGRVGPSSNWLGFAWLDRVQPDDAAKARAAWQDAAESKKSFTIDVRVRGDDDSYHWRRQYCSPIINEDGSVREWVGLSLLINSDQIATDSTSGLVTGAQIRAARGMLNWSVRDLADRTGLSTGALRRIEAHDGYNNGAAAALILIKDALSAGGVDFFVLPTGEAGVYPTRKGSRLKIVGKSSDPKKISA
ncbi:MAG: PAS domain-containing protein [Pseudolabrys sp.]